MAEGVSIREFARREGCSDTLVRKAIKAGKLRISAEKLIDAALIGSGWKKSNRNQSENANSTPQKGANPKEKVRAGPISAVRTRPSAQRVGSAADELFAEEAEDFLNKVLAGEFADLATAERIKENALAAKHLLAARKADGHLVEVEQAQTVLFETQRSQRDAWMNFPSRIGPLLAAELGVETDKVVEALTAHVHQQCADLGEPEADFTSGQPEV